MLQAESSLARDWRAFDLPDTNAGSGIVRKKVYKVNNQRKFFIKAGFILFSTALLLVFLCIKSATLGYQIEQLETDIQNLETANYRLDYQIAEKSSLARVEQIATTQLGMYKPDSTTAIAMEAKTEPVQVASAPAAPADNENISQKLLHKMYSSLSRLAQNSK